jgi:hypothetical protein
MEERVSFRLLICQGLYDGVHGFKSRFRASPMSCGSYRPGLAESSR